MKDIPDKSIDMILCDLPYGTTSCSWDTIIPFEPLWKQYGRIIKDNGAIVLTASQPFTSKLVMTNLKKFRHEIIWVKNRGSNIFNLKTNPMKEHESIIVFSNGIKTYNPQYQKRKESGASRVKYSFKNDGGGEAVGIIKKEGRHINKNKERHPSSIVYFNTEVGLHPTQKPLKLFEYLIKTYTNEGDTVLDNCLGSGTTLLACRKTGRNGKGFEINPDYEPIIRKRIMADTKTLWQFGGE